MKPASFLRQLFLSTPTTEEAISEGDSLIFTDIIFRGIFYSKVSLNPISGTACFFQSNQLVKNLAINISLLPITDTLTKQENESL